MSDPVLMRRPRRTLVATLLRTLLLSPLLGLERSLMVECQVPLLLVSVGTLSSAWLVQKTLYRIGWQALLRRSAVVSLTRRFSRLGSSSTPNGLGAFRVLTR
jgi:hypothetical protein